MVCSAKLLTIPVDAADDEVACFYRFVVSRRRSCPCFDYDAIIPVCVCQRSSSLLRPMGGTHSRRIARRGESLRQLLRGCTVLDRSSTYTARVDPVTEIHYLKALSVGPRFLANRNGQLIFGASTQLTRLDVLPAKEFAEFDTSLLQIRSS